MDRLATGVTEVVTLLELLVVSGSADDDASTSAVLLIVVPGGRFALIATTSVNWAVTPPGKLAIVQAMGPFVPTGGWTQSKVGPFSWLNETSVVFAGTASVRVTPIAGLPTPLATPIE
jgi:hypothetical protein